MASIFMVTLLFMIYFMFVTRRTVLRVLGWAAFFSLGIFYVSMPRQGGVSEHSMILNDLRALRSGALLFYSDFGTWPSPGQEASLDVYLDRPIIRAAHPRYARVTLVEKSGDANNKAEFYVGIERIPYIKKREAAIQKRLASVAERNGLLQQPVSGDIYKSGLNIYMRLR
jgi:hypothetical protein